jgi:hypothetical protein
MLLVHIDILNTEIVGYNPALGMAVYPRFPPFCWNTANAGGRYLT